MFRTVTIWVHAATAGICGFIRVEARSPDLDRGRGCDGIDRKGFYDDVSREVSVACG